MRQNSKLVKKIARSWTCAMISIVCLWTMMGCYSIKLDSHGDKVEKPLVNDWFCYSAWTGKWLCDNPEDRAKIMKPRPGVNTPTDGFRRVEITGNWWSIPISWITLEGMVPVHVECYQAEPDSCADETAEPIVL